jgi:hypothetical protein
VIPEPLNRNESGWFGALKSESSHHFFRNACTKSGKDKFIVNGKYIDPSQLSNKYFYNEYINVNFLKPIGINTWLRYLSINEKPNMSQLYSSVIVIPEPLNRNESGWFGALKSESSHHFFRNACTKSGSLRFSQFSGC